MRDHTPIKINKVTDWQQLAERVNAKRQQAEAANKPTMLTPKVDTDDRTTAKRSYLDDILETRKPVWLAHTDAA